MRPTVGRIVHYTNLGDRDGRFPPEAQAAIITKVVPIEGAETAWDAEETYRVSIRIFYELGDFSMAGVPFTAEPAATEKARGCWTWPARV